MPYTDFTSETLGNSEYIAAVFPGGQGIVYYQMQMLVGNEIKNILKASKKQKNNDVRLLFDVTDKIPLDEAIKGRKFSKKDMLEFIAGAANAIIEVGEYQLPASGIIFDPKYIFVEKDKFNPAFIYMPDGSTDGGTEQFKSLIKEFVTESKIERTNDNFIEELLSILNNPVADPMALKNFVNNYDKKKPTPKPADVQIPKINSDNDIRRPQPEVVRREEVRPAPAEDDTTPRKKQKPRLGAKKIVFIVLQPVIIAGIVALCLSGLIFNENGGIIPEYIAGIALAAAGLEFVLFRELMLSKEGEEKTREKETREKKTSEKKTKNDKHIAIPGRNDIKIPGRPNKNPAQNSEEDKPEDEKSDKYGEYFDKDTDFVEENGGGGEPKPMDGDTELMRDGTSETAYLEFYENGLKMRIRLESGTTRIGRRNFSVNNSRISKVHADFTVSDGQYFVTDRNSTNGTRINGGEKLRPGEEYQIYIGDTVTLADAELTLKK